MISTPDIPEQNVKENRNIAYELSTCGFRQFSKVAQTNCDLKFPEILYHWRRTWNLHNIVRVPSSVPGESLHYRRQNKTKLD